MCLATGKRQDANLSEVLRTEHTGESSARRTSFGRPPCNVHYGIFGERETAASSRPTSHHKLDKGPFIAPLIIHGLGTD
jgi:hypothetical protein